MEMNSWSIYSSDLFYYFYVLLGVFLHHDAFCVAIIIAFQN